MATTASVIMEELDLSGGLFAISGSSPSTSEGNSQSGIGTLQPHHFSNGHVLSTPLRDEPTHLPIVDCCRQRLSMGQTSSQSQSEYYQIQDEGKEMVQVDSADMGERQEEARSVEVHHCHKPKGNRDKMARNQLITVSVLCFIFMIAEIIGGILSNSLALVTDATHMASDLAGFMVSLCAIWMATKPTTVKMSFGFYRAEIIGALISILIIWTVTGVLVFLAIDRIRHPNYEIEANDMLIVASLGVVFNIVMGLVLHSGLCKKCSVPHSHFGGGHGHSHGNHSHLEDANESDIMISQSEHRRRNINVRAALIHVIGDLVQSIGVLCAAIVIKIEPDYKIADPICTFVFSILVMITTITVLRDIGLVLLEAVPRDVNYKAMKQDLADITGVKAVHSLNVWSLTMDKVAVGVHLAIDNDADWEYTLKTGTKLLWDKYHIFQCTIQVEPYQEGIMLSCEQCLGPKGS